MTTLYLVQRVGVHYQGVAGIFETQELAEIHALTAIRAEPDDYHDYEVQPFKLNAGTLPERWSLDQPKALVTFRRIKKTVQRLPA